MSFSLPTGRRRRLLVVVAPTVAAALLLAACSSSKKAASTPTSSAPAATTAAAAPSSAAAAPSSAATGSGAAPAPQAKTCADYAQYTSDATKGKTVTMFGSILRPESDSLNKSWAQFESAPASPSSTTAPTTSSPSCPCGSRVVPHLTWRSSRSLVCWRRWSRRRGQAAAGGRRRQRGQVLERGLEDLRLRQRHVLRRPHEREHEVARVVLAEGASRQAGYTVPTTWDRARWRCRTRSRPRQPSRGAAVSVRVRRPAGRPPTGSRRPSSARRAARSTTTG